MFRSLKVPCLARHRQVAIQAHGQALGMVSGGRIVLEPWGVGFGNQGCRDLARTYLRISVLFWVAFTHSSLPQIINSHHFQKWSRASRWSLRNQWSFILFGE